MNARERGDKQREVLLSRTTPTTCIVPFLILLSIMIYATWSSFQ